MHEARERIKKRKEDGTSIKDRLSKHGNISTGNHAKAGTNRLGKDTFELMKERSIKKEREMKDKLDEARRNWEKIVSDASTFLQTQKPVDK